MQENDINKQNEMSIINDKNKKKLKCLKKILLILN